MTDQWYLIDKGHSVGLDLIPVENTKLLQNKDMDYVEVVYPPTMETPGIDHYYNLEFLTLLGLNYNPHKKAHFFVPSGNQAGPLFITIEGMEPLKFLVAPILIEHENIRESY